ncbi:rod shape-determining protein MreD [Nonomuraea phyllanthi]|uniref:Rod shape-determining protein MreD n=1 Tax=Nonomuraea phyllanthi TaxID=2219224 RepID=A0A5C4VLL6_9ACTN|nr:rod shape-determining protein MreD [Nonomuraea phyllanthi]KAB8189304.1 rod shape-determining protein MreD [Nonomuraea phyllanthi]QFY11784.1 rod shape-determining protein MreD [Nonomuraea phyllanthi]
MIGGLSVVLALLAQVMLVNRLPLPGGGAPDLVLLAVIGAALGRGAQHGAVLGFCAGLLVDIMPPSAHLVGQYAFALAVVGYVAGRGAGGPVTTVVLCVLIAPLLAALVVGLVSDPRVTVAALTERVPVTVVYTLLVSPIVIWLTTRGREAGYST